MSRVKDLYHDEICENAVQDSFDEAHAEMMWAEMHKAQPYLGDGPIFGSAPVLGFSKPEPRKYSRICAVCDQPVETYQEKGTVWCDDCIPF